MDELIYSVKEVFSDFLRKELTGYYNIPEYQRGYKWNEANIVALLNDIEKFRQDQPVRRFRSECGDLIRCYNLFQYVFSAIYGSMGGDQQRTPD